MIKSGLSRIVAKRKVMHCMLGKRLSVFVVFILASCAVSSFGQTYTVTVTAKNGSGSHVAMSGFYVENLSKGWSQTIYAPDTTLILGGDASVYSANTSNEALRVYPNPFKSRVSLEYCSGTFGSTTISMSTPEGVLLARQTFDLESGLNRFEIESNHVGVLVMTVATKSGSSTIRTVNLSPSTRNTISHLSYKPSKARAYGPFDVGDMLRFVGYATINGAQWQSVPLKVTIEESQLVQLTFNYDQGLLPGVFSVSPNSAVQFSKGNLQYQPSTDTWRFAEYQYDYIGSGNVNMGENSTQWMDAFAWGTSGWHNSEDSNNVYHDPYSNGNMSFVNASYNTYGYGPSTNMSSPDLTGKSENYDWGVYNSISNGGNRPHIWRTLTAAEWNYLLTERPSALEKIGGANISGMNGYVILPDEWELPQGLTFSPGTGYSRNSYTQEQWLLMENNGAIFLHASGSCNLTTYPMSYDVNEKGNYWSTTHYDASSAYSVFFTVSQLPVVWSSGLGRHVGRSVRLVSNY